MLHSTAFNKACLQTEMTERFYIFFYILHRIHTFQKETQHFWRRVYASESCVIHHFDICSSRVYVRVSDPRAAGKMDRLLLHCFQAWVNQNVKNPPSYNRLLSVGAQFLPGMINANLCKNKRTTNE